MTRTLQSLKGGDEYRNNVIYYDKMTTPFNLKDINIATFNDILDNFSEEERAEFTDEPGKQHYKLLAYYSTLFNNSVLIDIGTGGGKSALALSYNKTNTVISFDVVDMVQNQKVKTRDNIEFYLENLWLTMANGGDVDEVPNKWTYSILNAPFIFLNVEPHNGTMEYNFYRFLRSIDYGGILMCNNIWYFKEMRDNFWYKIPDKYRYDVTEYGHWSGTGIIDFQRDNASIYIPRQPTCDNWTLVTAYFDLTKTPDASPDIKARDQNYYLNTYGSSTLHLPYNLVIYCDAESREKIAKIRPEYLKDRTKYVVCTFEDFQMEVNGKTFTEFREQIKENRLKRPYKFDSRNTPSYLLFCMARYIMLKETTMKNPFRSTHFAWINICIERMGYKNLVYLNEALACNRDKFSCCYISYRTKIFINVFEWYFEQGLCSFCSGFFTGNGEYMYKFCDAMLKKTMEFFDKGYGHSDETFYPFVYYDNPENFEYYHGDYCQMITNYKYLHENPEAVIHMIVSISHEYNCFADCIKTCEYVIDSYVKGKCVLTDNDMHRLGEFIIKSKRRLALGHSAQ